jgi:hypothetical protein
VLQVGAGILAIPSVTQESGFLASAVACVTAGFTWYVVAVSTLNPKPPLHLSWVMLNPCDERKHKVLRVRQKELQKAFCRKKDFSYQELWIFIPGNHGFLV